MPERHESLSEDQQFLRKMGAYTALRRHMSMELPTDQRTKLELRTQEMGMIGRELIRSEDGYVHRDALPLLADAAGMAALGYEVLPLGLTSEARNERARVAPLGKEVFLAVAERIFPEGLGTAYGQIMKALPRLQEAAKRMYNDIALPRAVSEELLDIWRHAERFQGRQDIDPNFFLSLTGRHAFQVLQHSVLEATAIFFQFRDLYNENRITADHFDRLQNLCLVIANAAHTLLRIDVLAQHQPLPVARRTEGGGTLPMGTSLAQERASAAWGQPVIIGRDIDTSEPGLAAGPFAVLMQAKTHESCRHALTPELTQLGLEKFLFEVDQRIADAKRIHKPNSVLRSDTVASVMGMGIQGSTGGLYQRFFLARTGRVIPPHELASMHVLRFAQEAFGYDLRKDPGRAPDLRQYTNLFM